jgi:hypothetical protein
MRAACGESAIGGAASSSPAASGTFVSIEPPSSGDADSGGAESPAAMLVRTESDEHPASQKEPRIARARRTFGERATITDT